MGMWSRLHERLSGQNAERAYREGFEFGVLIAEYLHHVPADRRRERFSAMFEELRRIAIGETTVVDTPEEFSTGKDYDDETKRQLHQMLNAVRATTKLSAQRILEAYNKMLPEFLE